MSSQNKRLSQISQFNQVDKYSDVASNSSNLSGRHPHNHPFMQNNVFEGEWQTHFGDRQGHFEKALIDGRLDEVPRGGGSGRKYMPYHPGGARLCTAPCCSASGSRTLET